MYTCVYMGFFFFLQDDATDECIGASGSKE